MVNANSLGQIQYLLPFRFTITIRWNALPPWEECASDGLAGVLLMRACRWACGHVGV